MTKIIKTPQEMIDVRQGLNGSVGFVPTMGALHLGHQKLLKAARAANEVVVLSIFVNPTQFNNQSDLINYPKTWEQDLKIAEAEGVDYLFYPNYQDMYPDEYKYKISENDLSLKLCGAHRPGHFDGVLTIVMKLFQIIKPHHAYFGEKDHQQLTLIQKMIAAYFLDVQLIAIPTVREHDGLAMSSRNVRLSPQQRAQAPLIYKIISTSQTAEIANKLLSEAGFKVDYVEDIGSRRYVAAFLGDVRLIDNVEIK